MNIKQLISIAKARRDAHARLAEEITLAVEANSTNPKTLKEVCADSASSAVAAYHRADVRRYDDFLRIIEDILREEREMK